MAKVPLYAGAEEKSYYKYYLRDLVGVSKEDALATEYSGSIVESLPIEDRTRLQTTECPPLKTGLYPLKGGGLLAASNVIVPNITGEMLQWWAAWHGLDPLRYAVWDSEDHYDVKIDDIGIRRIPDPRVPMIEKLWGVTHVVKESLGDKTDTLEITFMNPEEAGYDNSINGKDACPFLFCANAKLNGKLPVFMTEMLHKHKEEMQISLRFWIGYQVIDGKAKRKIPRFIKIPEKLIRPLLRHNFKEYHQLNSFLPQLYAEERDNW